MAFGIGCVTRQKILRQTVQLRRILHHYGVALFLDVASKGQAELGNALLQLLNFLPRRLILIHAGQSVLQQRPLQIVFRRGVRFGSIDRRQRQIDLRIQRKLDRRL